jgi:hypothetical protein
MKTDREHDGIVGVVRCVQTKTTLYPDSTDGDVSSSLLRVYDVEGRKIQDSMFRSGAVSVINTTYEYNEAGNLTGVLEYSEDSFLRKMVYHYDAEGRLVGWTHYMKDGQVGRNGIYEYINGIRVERIIEGAGAGKEVITYDDAGNRTDLGVYPMEIARSVVSVYDAAGNPTKVAFYGDEQLPLRELRLTYDSERKLIEVADFCPFEPRLFATAGQLNGDPRLNLYLKKNFSYDSGRRKIEEGVYNGNGSLVEKIVFVYNSEGRLVQKTEHASNNEITARETYTHELDSAGNWVKETMLIWDIKTETFIPAHVAERAIEYY